MAGFGDGLSLTLSANVGDFTAGMEAARSVTDEFGDEVRDTERTTDEFGDELTDASTSAGTFGGAIGGATGSVTLFNGLLTLSIAQLTVLGAVLGGVVIALGALTAGIGAVLGAGLLAYGEKLASQMEDVESPVEALGKRFSEIGSELMDLIADGGEPFVGLIEDLIDGIVPFARRVGEAVGSLEPFAELIRRTARLGGSAIPGLVSGLFDIGRAVAEALIVLDDLASEIADFAALVRSDPIAALESLVDSVDSELGELPEIFRVYIRAWRREFLGPLADSESDISKTISGIKREIRDQLRLARDIIGRFATAARDRLFGPLMTDLENLARTHFDEILAEVRETITAVWRGVIRPTFNAIQRFWREWGDEIIGVTRGAFNTIRPIISTAVDAIATTIRVVLNLIQGDWEEAWTAIEGFTTRTLNRIQTWLRGTGKALLVTAIDIVVAAGKAAWKGLTTAITETLPAAITDAVSWLQSTGQSLISDAFGVIRGAIESALGFIDLSPVRNALSGLIDTARGLIDTLNDLPGVDLSLDLPSLPSPGSDEDPGEPGVGSPNPLPGPGGAPRAATGGMVARTGALVAHAGERIVPASQVTDRGRVEADVPVEALRDALAGALRDADRGGRDEPMQLVVDGRVLGEVTAENRETFGTERLITR
jgi:hypothetical protein